jgi:HK97 family phage prohead protease
MSQHFRQVMPASIKTLGDDEVELTISTAGIKRDGHELVPAGADLTNYRHNPVMLWSHDPDHPVATAENVQVVGDKIVARGRFAPAGTTRKADETRGLVKTGIVRGVSVGWDPIEWEPIDPMKPRGGQRFTKWDLLEISFCAIPVDTDAMVTARAETGEADWKVGASRDLPIEDSDAWDGGEAEASIFAHAGGENFTPATARKGFLVYDAAHPKKRGSYKLPIAHVVDGEMKVPKGAIRAAASRLPQTDIPEGVKDSAQKVIDHYKEKAGMTTDDKDRALKAARVRLLVADPKIVLKRDLYDVAQFAYILHMTGCAHAASLWEAECEGDDSPVPAMIGEGLVTLGKALIAMTTEEVGELLSGKGLEMEDDEVEVIVRGLADDERAYVAAGKTPRARAFRRGIALARAGKTLSQTNAEKLDEAHGHTERAMKHHKSLGEAHEAVGEMMTAGRKMRDQAEDAHADLSDALTAVHNQAPTTDTARAVERCRALGTHLDTMESNCDNMADRHEDAGDSHRALGRSVRAGQRCLRAVLDGSNTSAETSNGDSRLIQKSDGISEDEGSRSVEFRQRQVELLELGARAA